MTQRYDETIREVQYAEEMGFPAWGCSKAELPLRRLCPDHAISFATFGREMLGDTTKPHTKILLNSLISKITVTRKKTFEVRANRFAVTAVVSRWDGEQSLGISAQFCIEMVRPERFDQKRAGRALA